MSTANRVNELLSALKQLFSEDANAYFAANRSFGDSQDSPDFAELRSTFERMRGIYQPLMGDPAPLRRLPFATINNLFAAAQNASNALTNARSNADAGVFRTLAQQLDGFAHQTQTSGLEYLVSGGDSIEAARQTLSNDLQTVQNELATLRQNNSEVETLRRQIQNLITPAVSGALSKSFTERRDSLKTFRNLWLYIAGVIAFAAAAGFYRLGTSLATALSAAHGDNLWAVVGLRFLFLVPVLVLLGFALNQYRKERNLEEEYAHKAAVAVTLPNYGDLLPTGPVRDQIVSGAANVILSSPIGPRVEVDKSSIAVISGANELVEAASKLMPWKK